MRRIAACIVTDKPLAPAACDAAGREPGYERVIQLRQRHRGEAKRTITPWNRYRQDEQHKN